MRAPEERLALHFGMLRHLPLASQIESCARAGITQGWLYEDALTEHLDGGGSVEAVRSQLEAAGITPLSISSVAPWVNSTDAEALAVATDEVARLADAIGSPLISNATRGAGLLDESLTASNLALMTRVSATHGVRLALEFLPWSPVPDVATLVRLLTRAAVPGVGMVVDSFHFWSGGSQLADLDTVPDEWLLAAHLSDVVADPGASLAEVSLRARRFPGDGELPVAALVAELERRRFSGPYVIEVLADDVLGLDAATLGLRSRASLAAVLPIPSHTGANVT